MLISSSKASKVREKAKRVISRTKVVLKKNSSNINPASASVIKRGIDKLELAMSGDDVEEIIRKTADLESFSDDYLSKFMKSKLRQNVEALVFALALALVIRTFVLQPFKIPSSSMIPTLLVGDHLFVNKFVYGTKIPFTDSVFFPIDEIKRGDVIVFTYPNNEGDPSKRGTYYIKRVIGVAGDRVDLQGRHLYVNANKVTLEFMGSYVDERNSGRFDEYRENLFGENHTVIFRQGREYTNKGNRIPAIVPEGSVFVMGDNRDNSQDSRFWGFVPIENIAGKAFIVHWSWDFGNPSIFNKVRWHRILSSIN